MSNFHDKKEPVLVDDGMFFTRFLESAQIQVANKIYDFYPLETLLIQLPVTMVKSLTSTILSW